jgi:hypothetical protein
MTARMRGLRGLRGLRGFIQRSAGPPRTYFDASRLPKILRMRACSAESNPANTANPANGGVSWTPNMLDFPEHAGHARAREARMTRTAPNLPFATPVGMGSVRWLANIRAPDFCAI